MIQLYCSIYFWPKRIKLKRIEENTLIPRNSLTVFFFNIESGTIVFLKTDRLSPYIKQGLLTGISIILSVYLKPHMYSQHCLIAI